MESTIADTTTTRNFFLHCAYVRLKHGNQCFPYRYEKYFMNLCGTFVVWCILCIVCWPAAILAILLFPVVWIFSVPFRLIVISVDAVLAFIRSLFYLPARIIGGKKNKL